MHRVVLPPRALVALAVLALGVLVATTGSAEPQYQIHGYLSQGYAWSSDYQVNGIPTAGTTDWRRMALQFRFMPTDQDQLVVQMRERRLGLSAVNEPGDESITLDWAFAQHSFGQTSLRAGVMPMPRGIYNQIRDVGVINPFYRAPYEFYTESIETVEGAQVNGDAQLGGGFGGNLAVFAGESNYRDTNPTEPGTFIYRRAHQLFGGQLWVTTPLSGLRVGAHYTTFTVDTDNTKLGVGFQQYSLDGMFDRFMARAEWRYVDSDMFKTPAWYVQGGVQLHPMLWVYGMYHFTESKINLPDVTMPPPAPGYPPIVIPGGWTNYYPMVKDFAGSLVFKPNSNLALKLEAHHNTGYNYDFPMQPFDLVPNPPYPMLPADDALTTNYVIASVAIAY